MSRVLACVAALVAVAALAVPAGAETRAARPNVVVFMTDDQSTDEMSVMPNVKRLIADRGVTFENNFTSYPLCCPSRATFLTGQYARNHGVLSNQWPRGSYYKLDSTNTLPVWLQKAGYDTIHIGKYLNLYGSRNPREVPPGWTEWHAAITNGYFNYTMNDNGRVTRYGSAPGDYEARVVTRKALAQIDARRPVSKPFFMWVAYHAPHAGTPTESDDPSDPSVSPARDPKFRGKLTNAAMPRSASFNEADISDKPPWLLRPPMSARYVTGLERVYRQELESLLSVDGGVRQIMDALSRKGLLDNTVVMFTSDNGVFHGEHRFGVSKFVAYEPSIRVPLVVRGPGFPRGRHTSKFAVNIDLAPTITELTGAHPDRKMDGRSLLDLFRRGTPAWRKDFIVEGVANRGTGIPPYVGLRTQRYFFVSWKGHGYELYDLAEDPAELRNVAGDPHYASTLRRLGDRYRVLAAEARRHHASEKRTNRTWIVAAVAVLLLAAGLFLWGRARRVN